MPERTSLPVRHLFTMGGAITDPSPAFVVGPAGTRVVVALGEGTFTGERLRGTVVRGIGGDFATVRADGSLRLDVRLVLQTEDGVAIYLTYNGVGLPDGEGGFHLQTAPTFEAPDGPYAWLNTVQAIAYGRSTMAGLTYEVYELLPV